MPKFSKIVLKLLTPKSLFYFGILCVIFLGIIILLDQVVMPWYTRHGEALAVPKVTARRFDLAKDILALHGLEIVKQGEKYNSQHPRPSCSAQHPATQVASE